jgi:xanthine dehydrogenase YagR molybdenum-binding subunit
MKFDKPATRNPTDRRKVIGKATDRYEGKLKATGTARYAYEWHDIAPKPAYGYVLGAAIAKGRIASIDTSAAESSAGVFAVVSAENAGPLGKGDFNTAKLLAGPEVQHYHQAVAMVVARTFEEARAAAGKIKVRYVAEPGAFDLAKAKDGGQKPPARFGTEPDSAAGDFDAAFAAAPVKLDATYTTPDQTHAMMEPFASIAAWKGDELTVWTANQMINWTRNDFAKTLRMDPAKVRVVSPYIGGGFGGKLFLRSDALLAALGARAAKRPVKVALQRPLMANNTTHRPATIQRVRLGATPDGKIAAFARAVRGSQPHDGDAPRDARPAGRQRHARTW